MAVLARLADALFGSIAASITAPTGLGPAAGGWIAARRTDGVGRGVLVGALAGSVGAGPWALLVYAASAGALDPVGYHEGVVHVGITPAATGTFTGWQAAALAALVAGLFVAVAAVGGGAAGASVDLGGEVRRDRSARN